MGRSNFVRTPSPTPHGGYILVRSEETLSESAIFVVEVEVGNVSTVISQNYRIVGISKLRKLPLSESAFFLI